VPGPEVLPNNVVAGPVLLAADATANTAEVCVADALGVVWVLGVQANGQVKQIGHWELKRKVTAGPFVRMVDSKARIGCVVDQRQLVWLDPKTNKPLWTYDTVDKPILGEPQLVDGLLIVTDQAGNIVGLDPATGKAETMGYSLQGSVAPVVTPVGFGTGQMFVPLSDGTITLLPMTYFRKPKAAPPAEDK
jgi:outer membrane protein assembly factor BamB